MCMGRGTWAYFGNAVNGLKRWTSRTTVCGGFRWGTCRPLRKDARDWNTIKHAELRRTRFGFRNGIRLRLMRRWRFSLSLLIPNRTILRPGGFDQAFPLAKADPGR